MCSVEVGRAGLALRRWLPVRSPAGSPANVSPLRHRTPPPHCPRGSGTHRPPSPTPQGSGVLPRSRSTLVSPTESSLAGDACPREAWTAQTTSHLRPGQPLGTLRHASWNHPPRPACTSPACDTQEPGTPSMLPGRASSRRCENHPSPASLPLRSIHHPSGATPGDPPPPRPPPRRRFRTRRQTGHPARACGDDGAGAQKHARQ